MKQEMTDDQYFELAARKLCEIRGLDPDKETVGGSPQWRRVESEVRRQMEVQRAMTYASLCKLSHPEEPTHLQGPHYNKVFKKENQ